MSLGKLTVLCTLCIFGLSQTDQSCPKFDPWLPWTDQCVWFPLNQMRQQMVDACQLKYSFSNRLPQIQWPKNFTKPDPCGFCSFKFRCHKRSRTDGCMTFEGEKKTCGQYSQICQLPMHPTYGCRWNTVVDSIKFCLSQESIPDWKRTEYMKLYSMLPEKNCMEKDGQCRCCCHPYVPNPTGTGCVLQPMTPEHQCTKFGSFNDWSSQCFWFPVSDMVSQFATHCGIDTVKDLPSGFVTAGTVKDKQNEYKAPERCGYCSFRARCRKRTPKSGCFSFNAEKKVCGEDDCKTCHQPCIMPTLTSGTTVTNHSSCDWQSAVMARYGDKMKQIQQSPTIPYVRKHGIQQLFKHMPRGTCQRFGDHCKCCCEPYIPSADGTECVLNDFCSKNY